MPAMRTLPAHETTRKSVASRMAQKPSSGRPTASAMSSTFQFFDDLHEQDPDLAGAWTAAAVNALEAGVEVVT